MASRFFLQGNWKSVYESNRMNMKKRIVSALALLVLVFSLTALGEESTITTKNEENRYSMSFSFFPVMIRMRWISISLIRHNGKLFISIGIRIMVQSVSRRTGICCVIMKCSDTKPPEEIHPQFYNRSPLCELVMPGNVGVTFGFTRVCEKRNGDRLHPQHMPHCSA